MCCMDAPEAQTLVKPRPTPAEPLSFANGGTIKRHHHHVPHVRPPSPLYRECLKNHAAAHGGHVLDGCGEFMPSPLASPADPTSLKCAACGCHRNFHRRDDDINAISLVVHNLSAGSDDAVNGDATPKRRSSSSASPPPSAATNPAPPPISSSYFPSAPQVLLALSTGLTGTPNGSVSPGAARKRFRTKFSREQKEKMFAFAEKIGWKMQKQDERIVEDFCEEVGVGKGVLKVWMHNNKHTLAKKDPLATAPVLTIEINNNSNQDNNNNDNNNNNNNSSSNEIEQNNNGIHLFNGSSSSS